MKELSKKELLGWLSKAISFWPNDTPTPKERQAYQQICQLIENQAEVDKEKIGKIVKRINDEVTPAGITMEEITLIVLEEVGLKIIKERK